jgi:heme/copper-type cytochrome/quinol oxidase subunit 4
MVRMSEVKVTAATAIAAAFGFIIALIWRDIIVGLFDLAGLKINQISDATGAIMATVAGIIITVVCILGIIYISKWGGVKK